MRTGALHSIAQSVRKESLRRSIRVAELAFREEIRNAYRYPERTVRPMVHLHRV